MNSLDSLVLIGNAILGTGLVVLTLCLIWQFLWTPWAQKRWYDWVFVIIVGLVAFIVFVASVGSHSMSFTLPLTQTSLIVDVFYDLFHLLGPLGLLSWPFVFFTLIIKIIFKRNLAAWFSRLLLLFPFVMVVGFWILLFSLEA